MGLFAKVLSFLGGCSHPQTYRERRELHGVPVLHLVCETCGYAVPAVRRTADEHRRIVEAGALKPVIVHRLPNRVVPVTARRQQAVRLHRLSAVESDAMPPVKRAG